MRQDRRDRVMGKRERQTDRQMVMMMVMMAKRNVQFAVSID